MKICEICGSEYDEVNGGCPNCEGTGKNVSAEAEQGNPSKEEMMAALAAAKAAGEADLQKNGLNSSENEEEVEIPKSKLKVAVIIAIVVGLLAIAGTVGAMWYMNENADKNAVKVVETYMQAYENKNIDNILNSYPDYMRKMLEESTSPEEIWNSLQENFTATYGEDWKASYTIGETTEIAESELTSLQQYINEYYSANVVLKSAYWVDADLTLGGSLGNETLNLKLAVAQIGEQWCVVFETTAAQDSSASTSAAAQ